MTNYNLILIFGSNKEINDQVLLCKKNKGPMEDKWNGLGGQSKEPLKDFYTRLGDLQIKEGMVRARKYGAIIDIESHVIIFAVYLNQSLEYLNFQQTNPNYQFWIRDPYKTVRAALKGLKTARDLAYIIPMAMDTNSDFLILRDPNWKGNIANILNTLP